MGLLRRKSSKKKPENGENNNSMAAQEQARSRTNSMDSMKRKWSFRSPKLKKKKDIVEEISNVELVYSTYSGSPEPIEGTLERKPKSPPPRMDIPDRLGDVTSVNERNSLNNKEFNKDELNALDNLLRTLADSKDSNISNETGKFTDIPNDDDSPKQLITPPATPEDDAHNQSKFDNLSTWQMQAVVENNKLHDVETKTTERKSAVLEDSRLLDKLLEVEKESNSPPQQKHVVSEEIESTTVSQVHQENPLLQHNVVGNDFTEITGKPRLQPPNDRYSSQEFTTLDEHTNIQNMAKLISQQKPPHYVDATPTLHKEPVHELDLQTEQKSLDGTRLVDTHVNSDSGNFTNKTSVDNIDGNIIDDSNNNNKNTKEGANGDAMEQAYGTVVVSPTTNKRFAIPVVIQRQLSEGTIVIPPATKSYPTPPSNNTSKSTKVIMIKQKAKDINITFRSSPSPTSKKTLVTPQNTIDEHEMRDQNDGNRFAQEAVPIIDEKEIIDALQQLDENDVMVNQTTVDTPAHVDSHDELQKNQHSSSFKEDKETQVPVEAKRLIDGIDKSTQLDGKLEVSQPVEDAEETNEEETTNTESDVNDIPRRVESFASSTSDLVLSEVLEDLQEVNDTLEFTYKHRKVSTEQDYTNKWPERIPIINVEDEVVPVLQSSVELEVPLQETFGNDDKEPSKICQENLTREALASKLNDEIEKTKDLTSANINASNQENHGTETSYQSACSDINPRIKREIEDRDRRIQDLLRRGQRSSEEDDNEEEEEEEEETIESELDCQPEKIIEPTDEATVESEISLQESDGGIKMRFPQIHLNILTQDNEDGTEITELNVQLEPMKDVNAESTGEITAKSEESELPLSQDVVNNVIEETLECQETVHLESQPSDEFTNEWEREHEKMSNESENSSFQKNKEIHVSMTTQEQNDETEITGIDVTDLQQEPLDQISTSYHNSESTRKKHRPPQFDLTDDVVSRREVLMKELLAKISKCTSTPAALTIKKEEGHPLRLVISSSFDKGDESDEDLLVQSHGNETDNAAVEKDNCYFDEGEPWFEQEKEQGEPGHQDEEDSRVSKLAFAIMTKYRSIEIADSKEDVSQPGIPSTEYPSEQPVDDIDHDSDIVPEEISVQEHEVIFSWMDDEVPDNNDSSSVSEQPHAGKRFVMPQRFVMHGSLANVDFDDEEEIDEREMKLTKNDFFANQPKDLIEHKEIIPQSFSEVKEIDLSIFGFQSVTLEDSKNIQKIPVQVQINTIPFTSSLEQRSAQPKNIASEETCSEIHSSVTNTINDDIFANKELNITVRAETGQLHAAPTENLVNGVELTSTIKNNHPVDVSTQPQQGEGEEDNNTNTIIRKDSKTFRKRPAFVKSLVDVADGLQEDVRRSIDFDNSSTKTSKPMNEMNETMMSPSTNQNNEAQQENSQVDHTATKPKTPLNTEVSEQVITSTEERTPPPSQQEETTTPSIKQPEKTPVLEKAPDFFTVPNQHQVCPTIGIQKQELGIDAKMVEPKELKQSKDLPDDEKNIEECSQNTKLLLDLQSSPSSHTKPPITTPFLEKKPDFFTIPQQHQISGTVELKHIAENTETTNNYKDILDHSHDQLMDVLDGNGDDNGEEHVNEEYNSACREINPRVGEEIEDRDRRIQELMRRDENNTEERITTDESEVNIDFTQVMENDATIEQHDQNETNSVTRSASSSDVINIPIKSEQRNTSTEYGIPHLSYKGATFTSGPIINRDNMTSPNTTTHQSLENDQPITLEIRGDRFVEKGETMRYEDTSRRHHEIPVTLSSVKCRRPQNITLELRSAGPLIGPCDRQLSSPHTIEVHPAKQASSQNSSATNLKHPTTNTNTDAPVAYKTDFKEVVLIIDNVDSDEDKGC